MHSKGQYRKPLKSLINLGSLSIGHGLERVAQPLGINLVRIFGMGGDAINGTENEN